MQHEAFLGFALEAFEALHVVAGAESCCDQGLGFAAGEDCAAVRAGQDSCFDPDFADLVERASIRTPLLIDHCLAEDALAQRLVVVIELALGRVIAFGQLGCQLLLDIFDQRVALGLGMLLGIERVGELLAHLASQAVEVRVVELRRLDFPLRLPCLVAQFVDRGANFLDLGVPEFDRVDDGFFFHFLRARLDHHDAVGRADHHDVQQAFAHLVVRRIDHERSIHQAHAHCADGTKKRNVGNGQRRRSAVDAGDVGIVIGIGGEHERNDLRLALESVGEHRTHRAIDLAAGEHFALTHAAFALDEASGETSAGIGVLAIIHGEGKEVDAFAGVGVGGSGGENDVLTHADDGGSVGLLGQFSGFE